jgi:hypothetical protein
MNFVNPSLLILPLVAVCANGAGNLLCYRSLLPAKNLHTFAVFVARNLLAPLQILSTGRSQRVWIRMHDFVLLGVLDPLRGNVQIEATIKRKAATLTHDGSWWPIWQGGRAGAWCRLTGRQRAALPCLATLWTRLSYTMSS